MDDATWAVLLYFAIALGVWAACCLVGIVGIARRRYRGRHR